MIEQFFMAPIDLLIYLFINLLINNQLINTKIISNTKVENKKFVETTKTLWSEEKFGMFTKGLSARLVQSILFSFLTILSYESLKRWSLLEEYKGLVRW